MRVIAGSAKSLPLKTLDGIETRPTTDRIKETLFNMIAPGLSGSHFLDLFSGSGGIGIEALSRGAANAVFVERNTKACACIRSNLNFTKLTDRAEVLCMDALSALHKMEGRIQFDYIFMDPPYKQQLEQIVMRYLENSSLLSDEGIIIMETAKDEDISYLELLGFVVIKSKLYKTNKHIFIEKRGEKVIC